MKRKRTKKNATVIALFILFTLILASVYLITTPTIKTNVITEFMVEDTLPRSNEKVKVVLLAGQSNATGYSKLVHLIEKLAPNKLKKLEVGFNNVYINYFNNNGKSSSHNRFEKVRFGQGADPLSFGPELGIASALSLKYPDQKIFIIKYTWGGTTLNKHWLSPSSNGKTGNLYTAFINFARTSLDYLINKGYDISLDATCWMQGESDGDSTEFYKYEDNLKNFIDDVRKDLSKYPSQKGLYFIDAGISNSPQWKAYKQINEAKKKVSELSPLNVFIDTISNDLSFNTEPQPIVDIWHYDALSELKLGILFAKEIISIYEK